MTDWEIPPKGTRAPRYSCPVLGDTGTAEFCQKGSAARVPRANLHPFSEVGVAADELPRHCWWN